MSINLWKQFVNESMSTLHAGTQEKLLQLNGAENSDELAGRLLTRFKNLNPQEFLANNPKFFHSDSILGPHGEVDGQPSYHDGPSHDRTPSNGGPGWSRSM